MAKSQSQKAIISGTSTQRSCLMVNGSSDRSSVKYICPSLYTPGMAPNSLGSLKSGILKLPPAISKSIGSLKAFHPGWNSRKTSKDWRVSPWRATRQLTCSLTDADPRNFIHQFRDASGKELSVSTRFFLPVGHLETRYALRSR
jgi:hypothetical protein